jgi:hypothetical protein
LGSNRHAEAFAMRFGLKLKFIGRLSPVAGYKNIRSGAYVIKQKRGQKKSPRQAETSRD